MNKRMSKRKKEILDKWNNDITEDMLHDKKKTKTKTIQNKKTNKQILAQKKKKKKKK